MKKFVPSLVLLSASALALAGCSAASADSDAEGTDSDALKVVASTNVYGDIAAQIGGDRVEVTSIITSATQDPHEYEASARDRLAVEGADLVIENGGGYDPFIDTLLADDPDVPVVTAVEYSHDYPGNEGHDHGDEDAHDDHDDHDHADEGDDHDHADEADDHADHDHDHGDDADDHAGHNHIEGFNEHIWFDPHTMIHVAEAIAEELGELDPAGAVDYQANAEALVAQLEQAEADLEQLKAAVGGESVIITEPVPGYLAAAAGLVDATPEGFAGAVESGRDVPPATLLAALNLVEDGSVVAVLTNIQTAGAETQRVEDAAESAGIPVVGFGEILPEGTSYAEWVQDAISSLASALGQ